jgi:hypothetical protein
VAGFVIVSFMASALRVDFEDVRKDDGSTCNEHRPNHPQYKLSLTEKIQQLCQAMRRFAYGAKGRDDGSARASKYSANERKVGEGLLEQQSCKGSVEYETSLPRDSVRVGVSFIRSNLGICNSPLEGLRVQAKAES